MFDNVLKIKLSIAERRVNMNVVNMTANTVLQIQRSCQTLTVNILFQKALEPKVVIGQTVWKDRLITRAFVNVCLNNCCTELAMCPACMNMVSCTQLRCWRVGIT
ncbi:hypothetical protein TNCV_1459361 [Trichonephila clavipes]|nr:hypothetical protein TNCV_1459361 [Trichonephila clavipes]